MKVLGLIGGTSWHSTIEYYRYINQHINEHYGNNTNPPLLVYTLNQALIHKYQTEGNWDGITNLIADAAQSLERAGADSLMLCANTPHKVYDEVLKNTTIPIIHIADATAEAIKSKGIKKVGFLGTIYSMTQEFITSKISSHNIVVLTPNDETTLKELHRIIQQELTYGNVIPESKEYVIKTIDSFIEQGAEGIILGCTEFPLMIKPSNLAIPLFNTTLIHAQAGVTFILSE